MTALTMPPVAVDLDIGMSTDLYAVADAICDILDAPITIEDDGWHVLAFSGRQEEADSVRVATVLARTVPERYRRLLEKRGVLRDLNRSHQAIYVDIGGGMKPRAAIAVRAGEQILGSIWAVVPEPLSAERERALATAADLVALPMLRKRQGADAERGLRADLLDSVLAGERGAAEAALHLGLAGERMCVIAAELQLGRSDQPRDTVGLELGRHRLCDALAIHVGARHPGSATALIGHLVYSIVPVHVKDPVEGEAKAQRTAELFLRQSRRRGGVNIGVGRYAPTLHELPLSQHDADRALWVLRRRGTAGSAVRFSTVYFDAMMMSLRDLISAEASPPTGPYELLAAQDKGQSFGLVDTLAAYLRSFGDVKSAAKALHVHPNTFRYRLRRVLEISGLDLSDPDAVLATMLQLRLNHAHSERVG